MSAYSVYLKRINKFPMKHSDEANKEMFETIRQTYLKIIEGNLRRVALIALDMHTAWPNFDIMDFVQEGNETLLRVVSKFDPTKDIKFSTFLTFCIKNDIIRYIKTNTGAVKLYNTTNQRKVFSQLCEIKKDFDSKKSLEDISYEYNIPQEDIVSVLGGIEYNSLEDLCSVSPEVEHEQKEALSMIHKKICEFRKTLTQQELVIFDDNMYKSDVSLQEIADYFSTSRQYMWKLKMNIIEKARVFFSPEDLYSITAKEVVV